MRTGSRSGRLARALVGAVAVGAITGPGSVAAASTMPSHTRLIEHHSLSTVFYPDDICGPRSGWTSYDVTWHFIVTDLGESYHVSYVETGKYTTDLDDPAFEDYTSQFTDAAHVNLTPGQTYVQTDQFHDFPGTITITVKTVFVALEGGVKVDRSRFEVSGCP